jgi:hypothetical protein
MTYVISNYIDIDGKHYKPGDEVNPGDGKAKAELPERTIQDLVIAGVAIQKEESESVTNSDDVNTKSE